MSGEGVSEARLGLGLDFVAVSTERVPERRAVSTEGVSGAKSGVDGGSLEAVLTVSGAVWRPHKGEALSTERVSGAGLGMEFDCVAVSTEGVA